MTHIDDPAVLTPVDGAHAQLAVALATAAAGPDGYRAVRALWAQTLRDAQSPDHPLHAAIDLGDLLWWQARITHLALKSWQGDRPDRDGISEQWLQGVGTGFAQSMEVGS